MPNSKARFIILKIVIAVMFAAVIWKLFDLQVLKGEQYYEIANDRMTTNIVEKAPRGEILDRYGTTLVSNKVGYSVVMQKTDVKDEEFNDIIKKLVDNFIRLNVNIMTIYQFHSHRISLSLRTKTRTAPWRTNVKRGLRIIHILARV